ncbi:MAG: baseplate J/gp47 family protein [Pseudomonadota bacterium]
MIDLASLPPPAVIEEPDFEVILAACKADFVARHPAAAAMIDLESEPAVKLLEEIAYRETLLRARYNDEARALMLAHSSGADLDHIAATYYRGETRLLVTPADPEAVPPAEAVWEADADFRARLALKIESYSVAGPRDAFKFHALSADGQVKDVSVTTPEGGTTEVFVLARGGDGTPDQALLDAVQAALDAEAIRPLSEAVVVSPAAVVNYALDVALTLFPGPATEVVLQAVNANLLAFAAAHHRLDADIVMSAIDAAAHVAGVKKVAIVSPVADLVCTAGQAPFCTGVAVSVAGVEA